MAFLSAGTTVTGNSRGDLSLCLSSNTSHSKLFSTSQPSNVTGNVLVVGSINTDLCVHSARLPKPGETLLGGTFRTAHGGKGANQAVAAARLGGHVSFVAKLGEDSYGENSLRHFQDENIDCTHVTKTKDAPSGVAIIMIDEEKGENMIIVADSANGLLSESDVVSADNKFKECDVVLLQLECPMATVVKAAQRGAELRKLVVLNPAPAAQLPDKLLASITHITPNETEASAMSGVEVSDDASAAKACKVIHNSGCETVIITMGGRGSFVSADYGKAQGLVPGHKVKALDTVGAGDCFNGALSVSLARGLPLLEAVDFANRAAAFAVQRIGTQDSYPLLKEL